MKALTVISRELRAEARHGFTYWLRVLAAAALMLAVLFSDDEFRSGPSRGSHLYQSLHGTLFVLIWIFVPLITADCISREKRQGTLGLLFLTPLKPGDIVIAKALAQGLRSLSLCLAVVPVLTIPFLMGGIPWTDLVLSILLLGSAFAWALSAGLLASAWNERWIRAQIMAVVLAAFCFLAYVCLIGFTRKVPIPGIGGLHQPQTLWQAAFWGIYFCFTQVGMGANPFLRGFVVVVPVNTMLMVVVCLGSLLFLLVSFRLTAGKIRRTWREEPPSAFQTWIQQVFCRPMLMVPLYRRLMRRKMEKNPIGWLQERTPSGRLITWSWFGILVSVYSFVFADERFHGGGFIWMQNMLAFGLLLSIAATAAGSFQRERETGLLELLLVSPVKSWEIVGGRLRGIWGQFLLVFGLWCCVWIVFANAFGWRIFSDYSPVFATFCVCSFVTVPVIGLYFSLQRRHFMTSLVWTLLVGLFFPTYLAGFAERLVEVVAPNYSRLPGGAPIILQIVLPPPRINLLTIGIQVAIAALLARGLLRNLARRKFAALERRD